MRFHPHVSPSLIVLALSGLLAARASWASAAVAGPTTDVLAKPPVPTAQPAKSVVLTFDADMTAAMQRRLASGKVTAWYDPAVIAVLEREKVPVRIFLTGLFAETYPDLVHSLAADPDVVIGNHTYDHPAFTPNCYGLRAVTSDQAKRAEIDRAQATIERLTGVTPKFFRYPGLCHDAHDDALVAQAGLTVDDGMLSSGDAFNRDTAAIVRHVLRRVQDGTEIVFHLGGPNAPATAAALEQIIPRLRERGFSFRN